MPKITTIESTSSPVVAFLGRNGSGKGTVLRSLNPELGYQTLTVSALLKQAQNDPNSEDGRRIRDCMNTGRLVSDAIVIPLVQNTIKAAGCPTIFDGFPRTPDQANGLLQMLKDGAIGSLHVIVLEVPEEEILERAADRLVCQSCQAPHTKIGAFARPKKEGICNHCGGTLVHRPDDKEETVRHRLKDYQTITEPAIEILEEAGISVHRIDNCNARPTSEVAQEFNSLLAGFLA